MHIDPTSVLLVGYGSTLRADDGAGPKVVESVEALGLQNVRTLSPTLLTPEVADPVAGAGRVIFVDAVVDGPDEVILREIFPAKSSQLIAHAASPELVLALARDVFGRAPQSWLITIPGEDFGAGEELSPKASAGVVKAVALVRQFVGC